MLDVFMSCMYLLNFCLSLDEHFAEQRIIFVDLCEKYNQYGLEKLSLLNCCLYLILGFLIKC